MPKSDERVRARALLSGLSREERQSQSCHLAMVLEDWLQSTGIQTLLATLPLPSEPDLTPLLQKWLTQGRDVALARVTDDRSLEFVQIFQWESSWSGWSRTLRQGPDHGQRWKGGTNAAALVPGLAFARRGATFARLGRGGGSFDRWLSSGPPVAYVIGIGYREQLWPSIVVEPHDRPVDCLATPDGVLKTEG